MPAPPKKYSQLLFDRRNLLAWLILVAAILLTGLASYLTERNLEQRALKNFNSHVDNVLALIQNRLHENEQILLGAAGLFNAGLAVDRDVWHRYISTLRLDQNYPGIQGVGYSQMIHPADLNRHIATLQHEGFVHYQVWPQGRREQYTAIIFIEPFTLRNKAAFGYDMLSETTRAKAMMLAMDTGQTTITGKVKLVQEIGGVTQAGFLMFVPVYARDQPIETEAQRRTALKGFVYSPFRADDLMAGIMNQTINPLAFTIYDNNNVKDDARLYRSPAYSAGAHASIAYADLRQFNIFGHPWTIRFESFKNTDLSNQTGLVSLIAVMGTLLSLALFLIVSLQIFRRDRAEQMIPAIYADLLHKQKELEKSEQCSRAIIETAPTAARIARIGDNQILFCNRRYLALTDISEAQLADFDPSSYYADPTVYAKVRQRLDRGEQTLDLLVEIINPYAQAFTSKWVMASYFIIQYQNQSAVLAWFHEITDRVRDERLKNEFISTVNHELRTPLTAINGALGLISNGVFGPLNQAIVPLIVLAEKNTRRLMTLVDDLLDMEKMTAGKMTFDMERQAILPLLEQALEINQHYQLERGVRLVLQHPPQEFIVRLDSQRLMQIMANLLSNAIKYSPDHGTVEIVVGAASHQRVRISVTDHGSGIPDEFRHKIFEKFTQADATDCRKKGGTGLGLAITRELVTGMGGTIDFALEPGQGTCFYIEFALES